VKHTTSRNYSEIFQKTFRKIEVFPCFNSLKVKNAAKTDECYFSRFVLCSENAQFNTASVSLQRNYLLGGDKQSAQFQDQLNTLLRSRSQPLRHRSG
jgi:hypothetical protein